MSNVPNELRYTKTHEWVRKEKDGTLTIGITDHAQALLGDLVYVEAPEVGGNYETGEDCAVVESVKAASDVYAPLAGEVVQVNPSLADTPETINRDPYGAGWIFRIKPEYLGELDDLLDATAYSAQIANG
ncbi:MAG: glycine cleavage system protein GcvH [Gammaproteobacteria bacterium]|nr:glycine cleavage system protein GcvH [Gammaproteobacteria bacterium]